MARLPNTPKDVFRRIDMKGGDIEQCWPWKGKPGGRDGRPYFDMDGTKVLAYRIAYEVTFGVQLEKGKIIRHKCDNGAAPVMCCNPYHLVPGSHVENMRDMRDRERHGLPHHTVRLIRKLGKEGRLHREIAEMFGMSRRNVTDILNGKTYTDVEEVDDD